MKGSHVAALVIGWLAVALGSAVIGSASIARVGLGATQPQSQITVSRSAAPMRALPTGEGVADFVGPDAAPASSGPLTAAPTLKPSARTVWPAPALTAAPLAVAPTDTTPAVDLPPLPPSSGPTLGVAPPASSTPSSTSPGKGSSKKGNGNKSTPTPVPSALLAQ